MTATSSLTAPVDVDRTPELSHAYCSVCYPNPEAYVVAVCGMTPRPETKFSREYGGATECVVCATVTECPTCERNAS